MPAVGNEAASGAGPATGPSRMDNKRNMNPFSPHISL